jgi:hypothetical protein
MKYWIILLLLLLSGLTGYLLAPRTDCSSEVFHTWQQYQTALARVDSLEAYSGMLLLKIDTMQQKVDIQVKEIHKLKKEHEAHLNYIATLPDDSLGLLLSGQLVKLRERYLLP